MKPILFIVSFTFLTCHFTYSQGNTEELKNQKLDAMKKLSFMIGTWEGTGWIQMGNASKETFGIHETIQEKLDGLVYLIEGHGTTEGTTTHKALAMISWNPEKGQYGFESHTFDGRSAQAVARLENRTFIWGFNTPNGGLIRYRMEFKTDHEWFETGAYSPDGETWYPFMEMTLNKLDNKP